MMKSGAAHDCTSPVSS